MSAKYNLRLNYVVEIRPTQLLDFFRGEVINGARDRATFCEILPLEDRHQWPKMGELGDVYFDKILPYIENIQAAKGTITCLRAKKLVDKIRKYYFEYYDETQDDVLELMTHRALVRVFRRACLCFIANGQKWDPALDRWLTWSFQYDLWMQFHYFYDAIKGQDGKLQVTTKGPDPILFGLIPGDTITFEQIKQRYKDLGKETDDKQIKGAIRQWVKRGKLERVPDKKDVYRLMQEQRSKVA